MKTPDGTYIESIHRHDYVTHIDAITGEEYMVDGGTAYLRRSVNNVPAEDMSLYDDEPHEVQREVITWGTYGKHGDQPLTRKTIASMETEHIQAVLKECNPSLVIKNCMEKELQKRLDT
jgi:hypothetical protein